VLCQGGLYAVTVHRVMELACLKRARAASGVWECTTGGVVVAGLREGLLFFFFFFLGGKL
jgi:hypothetical protein